MHGYGGCSKELTFENSYVSMQVLDSGVRPSGLEVLQNVYGVTECTVYQVKKGQLLLLVAYLRPAQLCKLSKK